MTAEIANKFVSKILCLFSFLEISFSLHPQFEKLTYEEKVDRKFGCINSTISIQNLPQVNLSEQKLILMKHLFIFYHLGSYHFYDLWYFFKMLLYRTNVYTDEELKVADYYTTLFTNFAKYGLYKMIICLSFTNQRQIYLKHQISNFSEIQQKRPWKIFNGNTQQTNFPNAPW